MMKVVCIHTRIDNATFQTFLRAFIVFMHMRKIWVELVWALVTHKRFVSKVKGCVFIVSICFESEGLRFYFVNLIFIV